MANADDVISSLGLIPHPEGGMYRETYRAQDSTGAAPGLSACTLIYFLLRRGEVSSWHCVSGSDEHFLYHGGDAYHLLKLTTEGEFTREIVGMDLSGGQMPQHAVPAGCWQAGYCDPAGSFGWSLVACLVSPGFEFENFEMASDEEMAARFPGLSPQIRLPRL